MNAAANLASTICVSVNGSDNISSIVPDLFSSAKMRIVTSGITSSSSRLMLWKVPIICATLTKNRPKLKNQPASAQNTASRTKAIGVANSSRSSLTSKATKAFMQRLPHAA